MQSTCNNQKRDFSQEKQQLLMVLVMGKEAPDESIILRR